MVRTARLRTRAVKRGAATSIRAGSFFIGIIHSYQIGSSVSAVTAAVGVFIAARP
jgi:hypothetical protein